MRASPAGRGRLPTWTPVLFVIDGDPGAAHALRDDLSCRFGREFRIVCESAADAGLAALGELAVRRVPVALLVVGQDLGGMSGVAFLGRAREMHPQAVRVLPVERDYSAPSPIVQAMILGQADSHITKPWMVELDLYSVVSDCLADWARNAEAAFDLFSIVGLDDRAGHELRELLIRFNVPFRFVAADSGKGRRLLADHGVDDSASCAGPLRRAGDDPAGPRAARRRGRRDRPRRHRRLRRRGVDRTPLPLETSMPGVFAIGDVRYRSIKRVASAVGDGATAIRMIHEYLAAELTGPPVRIIEPGPARPPRPRPEVAGGRVVVLRVSLLGELSITGDLDPGTGPVRIWSARAVALVAFLVLHAGSPQSWCTLPAPSPNTGANCSPACTRTGCCRPLHVT